MLQIQRKHLEELIEAPKEAWHAIDQQVQVKLSTAMPHRVKAVIEPVEQER